MYIDYGIHMTKNSDSSAINKSGKKDDRIKAGKKNSQLVIRINADERDEFISLCEDLDTSAAREIRRFIRSFVAEHKKP